MAIDFPHSRRHSRRDMRSTQTAAAQATRKPHTPWLRFIGARSSVGSFMNRSEAPSTS